jgi:hypothetical protein
MFNPSNTVEATSGEPIHVWLYISNTSSYEVLSGMAQVDPTCGFRRWFGLKAEFLFPVVKFTEIRTPEHNTEGQRGTVCGTVSNR